MKTLLRKIIGFITAGIFILCIKIISFFTTREKAIKIVSPLIAKFTKFIVSLVVPKIKNYSEFNKLSITIVNRLKYWTPVFDYTIAEQSDDLLKLNITYCPMAIMAKRLGYPELGQYICQGDWDFAKDNSDKFIFERTHQIGTGASFCNHTYIRKK